MWNFGKMYVYSLQKDPFIHVDFDIIFKDGCKIPETDIITERVRQCVFNEKNMMFSRYNMTGSGDILCSGILGGNNYGNIFKDNYNYFISKADPDYEYCFDNLYSIEEISFTQLVAERGLSYSEINSTYFDHYQGQNKESKYDYDIKKLRYKSIKNKLFN